MTTRIMPVAIVLVVGATIGWLLANHWSDSDDPKKTITAGSINPVASLGPLRFEQDATTTEPGPKLTQAPPQDNEVKAPPRDILMGIQAKLEYESAQRRLLERRVQELSDEITRLGSITPNSTGRPLATVASVAAHNETRGEPEARAKARTARFRAVGFDAEEEKQLTRRMDEVEMERLFLRDRAQREGWRRTPEYRQAARELRNELRNELGEDAYDRLLYANEQDNRVLVEKVLESSPAQEIGLQAGDVILGYDGRRVFSNRDIRTARATGEAGDPVPLRIERNGEELELEIPRGPLGVHLDTTSVMP